MNEPVTSPERQSPTTTKPPTRDLFIRGVPEDVWDHVHHAAIRSRLPLKHFLIETMRRSQPLPRAATQAPPVPAQEEPGD